MLDELVTANQPLQNGQLVLYRSETFVLRFDMSGRKVHLVENCTHNVDEVELLIPPDDPMLHQHQYQLAQLGFFIDGPGDGPQGHHVQPDHRRALVARQLG